MLKVVLHVMHKHRLQNGSKRSVNIFTESAIHNPYLNLERVMSSRHHESVLLVIAFTS
jgi:hypothetical protein